MKSRAEEETTQNEANETALKKRSGAGTDNIVL
jgi:hypothetical protein